MAAALAVAVMAVADVLMPFLLALILAYIMAPLVERLTPWMPRWVAVITSYLLLFGTTVGFVYYTIPKLEYEARRLGAAVQGFLTDAPSYYGRFEENLRSALGAEPPSRRRAERPEATGEAADASRWGLGPNLGLAPDLVRADIPRLDDVSFPVSVRDLIRLEELRLPDRDDGALPRSLEEVDEAARRANVVLERLGEGTWGVRINQVPVELLDQGEGRYTLVPREGAPAVSRIENLRESVIAKLREGLERLTEGLVRGTVEIVQDGLRGFVGFLVGLILTFMVAAFLLIDLKPIQRFFRGLVPPRFTGHYQRLVHELDLSLAGVVRGQLMICLVNGVLSGIGYLIFIPEYALVLAVFAGVLSLIPIFGMIISTIPALLVALTHGTMTAVLVLLWLVFIHLLESNVLNPKIIGSNAKIHPVIVVFALIAGEHYFGIKGAVMAVPLVAVVQVLSRFAYARVRPAVMRW